jgi:RNA polymerase sigma-70 factor (ECF subfamily)
MLQPTAQGGTGFETHENRVTDEALVEEARRGVHPAFTSLVERYQHRVYRLAVRMSHNASDAEEITQETFLRALRGLDSFEGAARFGTWIYRIAMNEALMRRRSAKRRPAQSLEELRATVGDAVERPGSDAPPGADELLARRQVAERVRAALGHLDEAHRAALVLRDLEGLSAEEAADILGISPEAVRQRAHRARLRLRSELEPFLVVQGAK